MLFPPDNSGAVSLDVKGPVLRYYKVNNSFSEFRDTTGVNSNTATNNNTNFHCRSFKRSQRSNKERQHHNSHRPSLGRNCKERIYKVSTLRSKSMNSVDLLSFSCSQQHIPSLLSTVPKSGIRSGPGAQVPDSREARRRMSSSVGRLNSRRRQTNELGSLAVMDISTRDFFIVEFNQLGHAVPDDRNNLNQLKSELTGSGSDNRLHMEQARPSELQTDPELIFAIGGVPLREALQGIFEKRHILADRVHVFLEASSTPLPMETDTAFLGGNRLYVKAKDSDSPFSRATFYISSPSRDFSSANNIASSSLISATASEIIVPCSSSLLGGSAQNQKSSTNYCAPTTTAVGSISKGSCHKKDHSRDKQDNWKIPITLSRRKADQKLEKPVSFGDLAAGGSSTPPPTTTNGGAVIMTASSDLLDTQSTTGSLSGMELCGGSVRKNRSQGRLSQIFPNNLLFKQDKMDIQVRLAQYQESGLPDLETVVHSTNIQMSIKVSDLYLELHWRNIVNTGQNLSKRQQEQQEALWELVETELSYIKKLRVIAEFLSCLLEIQADGYLVEVDPELVFGNILEVYASNLHFWKHSVEPFLDHSRKSGEPLDPIKLEPGFCDIHSVFHSYVKFSLIHSNIVQYLSRKQKDNEQFRDFIMWAQTQKCSGRLQLTDLLVKPMQRLTKYPLLLKAILKNTADVPTRNSLMNMIAKVEDFLSCINFELRYKQHFDSLHAVMLTFDSYDAVDCTLEELAGVLRQFSILDLTMPMIGCNSKVLRLMFLQGDLKLRDAYSKMDVHCFLFTDMFLVTKQLPRKNDRMKLKIVRQPFHIDSILVQELRESPNGFAFIYLNEFGMASTAFTLHASQAGECQRWLETFRIAKDTYKYYKDNPSDFSWLPLGESNNFEAGGLNLNFPPTPTAAAGTRNGAKLSTVGAAAAGGQHHLTVNSDLGPSGGPHRRISIGAMESARRRYHEVQTVNHGRSVSMDSTVLAIKATGTSDSATSSNCSSFDQGSDSVVVESLAKSGSSNSLGTKNPLESLHQGLGATSSVSVVHCGMVPILGSGSDSRFGIGSKSDSVDFDDGVLEALARRCDSPTLVVGLTPPKTYSLSNLRSMLSPTRLSRRKSSSFNQNDSGTGPSANGRMAPFGEEGSGGSGDSSPVPGRSLPVSSPSELVSAGSSIDLSTLGVVNSDPSMQSSSETLVPSLPGTQQLSPCCRMCLSRSASGQPELPQQQQHIPTIAIDEQQLGAVCIVQSDLPMTPLQPIEFVDDALTPPASSNSLPALCNGNSSGTDELCNRPVTGCKTGSESVPKPIPDPVPVPTTATTTTSSSQGQAHPALTRTEKLSQRYRRLKDATDLKILTNRRSGRRYHTADSFDGGAGGGKSGGTAAAAAIRKRFSWNNFIAKAARSSDVEDAAPVLRVSTNCLSSDSFCSSSGVSSSSSQVCVSQLETEELSEESSQSDYSKDQLGPFTNEFTNSSSTTQQQQMYKIRSIEPSSTAARHVSRVSVGEDGAPVINQDEDQKPIPNPIPKSDPKSVPKADPKLVSKPVPKPVPTIQTEPPTPLSGTPSNGTPPMVSHDTHVTSSPANGCLPNNCKTTTIPTATLVKKLPTNQVKTGAVSLANHNNNNNNTITVSKDELLKLIMDNKLESSDV